MDTLRAAQRLDGSGFFANKFSIPLDDGIQIGSTPRLYVNWPTGATVVNGALLRLGAGPLELRLLALVVAGGAVAVFYRFVVHISERPNVAIASVLWFATLAPFRLLADSFTYFPWDWFGRSICLLSCVKLADLPNGHRRMRSTQVAVAIAPFLCLSFLGIEMLPGSLLFGTVYSFLFAPVGDRWRRFFRVWIPLAIGTIGGLTVRAFHARWVFGSFEKAFEHLRTKAGYRLGSANSDTFVHTWAVRFVLYFGPGLMILTIAAAPIVRRLVQSQPSRIRLVKIFSVLMIGDLLWPLAARQHSAQHTHTAMHLFFSTSLLFGILTAAGFTDTGLRRTVIGAISAISLFVNLFLMPLGTTGNIADNLNWSGMQNITRVLESGDPKRLPVWAQEMHDPTVPFFLTVPFGLERGSDEVANRTYPLTIASRKQDGRLLANQFGYRMYSERSGLSFDEVRKDAELISAISGTAPGGIDGYTLYPDGSVTFRFSNQLNPTAIQLSFTVEGPTPGASFVVEHRLANGGSISTVQTTTKSGITRTRVPIPFGTEQVLKVSLRCDDARTCDTTKYGFAISMEY
jgi:hypothetical protein